MTWTTIYRLALWTLPAGLRRKHGPAMEALFARELARASARGWLRGVWAGAAGIWDVLRRGAYEQMRPNHVVASTNLGGPPMPQPTTRQLLLRHAASFVIAFVALTTALVTLYATRRVPALRAQGMPTGTIAEVVLLAAPFTAAMTIPMAVLVAVLFEFSRLGADGTLAAARRERAGIRRLVLPVLGGAMAVAALSFVVTAEIVPRTNQRLVTVLSGGSAAQSDRTMTIGELRNAARTARPGTESVAIARTARYEVEIQKKLALPAACLVLALVGVAIVVRVPRGGAALVISASCVVFGAYYALIITGEGLADRMVVSPFVGMWGANAFLLAVSLLALWSRRAPGAPSGREPIRA